jgi:hypothetical protein
MQDRKSCGRNTDLKFLPDSQIHILFT